MAHVVIMVPGFLDFSKQACAMPACRHYLFMQFRVWGLEGRAVSYASWAPEFGKLYYQI